MINTPNQSDSMSDEARRKAAQNMPGNNKNDPKKMTDEDHKSSDGAHTKPAGMAVQQK